MKKLICLILIISLIPASAFAADGIGAFSDLRSALSGRFSGDCILTRNIDVTNVAVTASVLIDGNSHTLNSVEKTNNSTFYQNEKVVSGFSNVVINGNQKDEVGFWVGAGSMTLRDCVVQNYSISGGRYSAAAVGSAGYNKHGHLILYNVKFLNNSDYDINISDFATVTVNEGTVLSSIRIASSGAHLNIGENWSGAFSITMADPTSMELGTVSSSADISGITVTNYGYHIDRTDGLLLIKRDDAAEIFFDASSKGKLYKGSAGFLYGVAEIGVPSIELLTGIKPHTMVQKVVGGLQHPSGDVVRVSSALEASGARDMQVYLQDYYLEWPYNSPKLANGSLDVDAYCDTCIELVLELICDEDENGEYLAKSGKRYTLNKTEARKYSYVPFNEPDGIWFGSNDSGLCAAWKTVYDAIHEIDPDARCAGPNFASYNKNRYDYILNYCYENNCLPEIVTWHELGDVSITYFVDRYNEIYSLCEKYYTDEYFAKSDRDFEVELLVNEYARHYDIGAPGGIVKWLAMFEDKDMAGCLAYWSMANSMNELAALQNAPASSWWVYHWYAQMTGEQMELTYPAFTDTRFYGVASYDEDIETAYVLFGGSEDKHGSETVWIYNLDGAFKDAAHVKLYGVSFSGQQGVNYKPETVFDGAVAISGGTIEISVADTDEMDAFFAVITPTDELGGAMENVRISTISYEAENAALLGNAAIYDKKGWSTFATSGRRDVGTLIEDGDGVRFTVAVPESGLYELGFFYALQAPYVNALTLTPDASGQNRAIGKILPFGVSIDGGEVQTVYLDTTVSWRYRTHYDFDAYLESGEHTIDFIHINGSESNKGNLELSASPDKLDVKKVDPGTRYDFEIDFSEEKNFFDGESYRVCAVAPMGGYYRVTADGEISLAKQSTDYAKDALSWSDCAVYDNEVSDVFYLAQGANILSISGNAKKIYFDYDAELTLDASATIGANELSVSGEGYYYRESDFASSGYTVADLSGEENYIEFTVDAPSAGVYNFAIRYANDEPAPPMKKSDGSTYIHPYNIDLVERFAQIKIGDREPQTIYFRNTLSWDTFRTLDAQFYLDEGENTVRIYNDNSYHFSELVDSTAPEIDSITITRQSYDGTVAILSSAVDTTELDALVAFAQNALNHATLYTTDSLMGLMEALYNVKAATPMEVLSSKAAVSDAIDALEFIQTPDTPIVDVSLTEDDGGAVADFFVVYGGDYRACAAGYDESGALVFVKSTNLSDAAKIKLPAAAVFKAFVWDENLEPVCEYAALK